MPEISYEYKEYASREEWLADRRIGGTAASAIVGKNPWRSAIEIYRELTYKKFDSKDSPVLQYGRKFEPMIRRQFAIDFEKKYKVIAPKDFGMYIRTDKPYMSATVDGLLIDKETKEKGILEIKTHDIRNRADADEWESGTIPIYYLIQVLHYLNVLNDYSFVVFVPRLNYFEFDGKSRKLKQSVTRYEYIERKEVEKQLAWLEKEITKFWENNVMKGIPPQPKIDF